MITLISTIYTLLLAFSFIYGNFFIGLCVLIIEAISLCFIPLFINIKKNNLRSLIESDNISEPIINVNKTPWYLFEEVPYISRIQAKRMVFLRRKYGNYPSLDVFFKSNEISNEIRMKINKYFYL